MAKHGRLWRSVQMEQLQNAIPQEARGSIAVCGLSSADMDVFLKTDLLPAVRYCFLTEWRAKADLQIRAEYLAALQFYQPEERYGEYELYQIRTH